MPLYSLPLLTAGLLAIAFNLPAQAADASSTPSGGVTTLTLDLNKPGPPVSPSFSGLMTEEINHSYDGGLYAELIQNRIFADDANTPVHWSLVQEGGASGAIALDKTQPIEPALHVCLRLDVAQAGKRVGVANDGFSGIPVKPATTYRVSFYAKAVAPAKGPLTVDIESNDGATLYAQAQVPGLVTAWRLYHVTLTTAANVTPTKDARFVISTPAPGTLWLNYVSLFPPTFNDRPNGNRIDIMQLLAGLNPKFLRFPGGNYLEGSHIDTRFDWKKTLGFPPLRPGHQSCWHYRSSDGMGLLEFLEWCEDLKMTPLLAVYAGYSLSQEHIQPGPALKPFVDDALDELEYVTGGVKTKWGAERAREGHPAPFPLTYVEIGNEDQFDRSHSYDGRFTQFYDAIKAKYPNLQLIATTKVTSRVPDAFDNHFYRSSGQMEGDTTHYDSYSRTGPKIFVGEWATRTGAWNKTNGGPTPDMSYALSDAAWLTGLERNSDLVVMQCYAPLLVNVSPGARQWEPDLIGYDALHSYGSPSYYAQSMFSTYLGDKVVPITAQNVPMQNPKIPALFYVATRESKTGAIDLKLVNTSATPQPVQINITGAPNVSPQGLSIVLAANSPADTNSITEPAKLIPVTSKATGLGTTFTRTLPPYSINVLQIQTR